MDADKKAKIQAHVQALAALLYAETDPEQLKTLEGIEAAQVLKHRSAYLNGQFSS